MLRRSKWLSLLLVFSIMFLAIAPQASLAAPSSNQVSANQGPQAFRSKNIKHLIELTDKRDQHTKYYLNDDGSNTAEVSIASRHYQDAQGKWQDISNKIISSDDPGFNFRNEANSFWTYFTKNTASQFLTKFKLDQNHIVSWSLDNANKVSSVSDTYSVTYPEILTSTDLQYQPFSDGLKENIILKDNSAPNSFQFELMTNGLVPVQQSNGTIALQDDKTGEAKYIIPNPYMIDSNQQLSRNVTMTLAQTQNPNVYTIVITADLNWLKDPSRSFPITIDPSITNTNSATNISSGVDTYITSYAPNTYYSTNTFLATGHDGVNNGTIRTLLQFPISNLNIPTGAIVTDGALSLYKYTNTSYTDQIDVRQITSSWNSTVTWNTPLSVDTSNNETNTSPGASSLNVNGSTTGWLNFNVWAIVKGWVNGGITNNGVEVEYHNESDPVNFFYSSESSTGYGPLLSITYITDETGLNPYWGYANTPAGSVNTFNGNLLSSVMDFSLPGRGIPINVTRTYNSRGNLTGIFGSKWFSNLDMQLQFPKNSNNNVWGAVFLDSAGTEHIFMLKSDGVSYLAPNNYPVQLYNMGNGTYRIQEAYATNSTFQSSLPSLVFNSNGQLVELDDGKGNATTVTWNLQSSPQTVVVKDPSGRTATLTLNSSSYVDNIQSSAETGKVKASYQYSGANLTRVTYDNGNNTSTNVNYTWNSSGLLSSLTNKNGTIYYITYNGSNKVQSIGPVNMLSNPSFESGVNNVADSWPISPPTADNGSITQSYTIANPAPVKINFGKSVLDIKSVYQSGTSGSSYLYATQKIPVKPGQNYNISGYILTNNLGGSSTSNPSASEAFLNVQQQDANGNQISWSDTRASGVSGTSTDWTRNSKTVTSASTAVNGVDAAYFVVYLEVQHDSTHFGGDAYFDGVQMEQVPTSTSLATSFEGHSDFRYGPDGSLTAAWVTSPAGQLTEFKSDNYGTPVAVINDPRNTGIPKSETDLSWSASDHLQSLTAPNQVNSGSGKSYSWKYNMYDTNGNLTGDLGWNPSSATDPLGRTSSASYYDNRLQNLTLADNSVVKNGWDPALNNLNTDLFQSSNQTLNSQAYKYDSVNGNLTSESNVMGVADNRVLNSSFNNFGTGNQPANWTAYSPTGTVVNQVVWDGTAPFGGSNDLKINPGNNAYAYQWSTNTIALNGIDTFILSGYMKTGQTGSQDGACLNVYWYDNTGGFLGANRYFNVRSTQWQRYSVPVTPPSYAASAKVMAITYGPYDGYFNNIQFEKSSMVRGYNYLEDSSFELQPSRWTSSDSNATTVNDGSNAYSGSYDAQISRSTVGTSYLESQSIPVNQGQYYTLAGFIRTNGVSGSGGAWLHVFFYDSTGAYVNDYVTNSASQTSPANNWTKYFMFFTPPTNATTLKVRVELAGAQGTASFDNIRLSPGKLVVNNTYNTDKNYVTNATNQLNNNITINPDPYGQAQSVTTQTGETNSYTYDGQERLRTATDNANTQASYGLDSNGNVTGITMPNGSNNYQENFTYDVNNNLTQESDLNTNKQYNTNYTYDEDGRLITQTNPNGTGITNDYDNYGNLNSFTLSDGSTYSLGHDLEGHRTSVTSSDGTTNEYSYGYDAVGNLITFLETDGSGKTTTIGTTSSPNTYSVKNQLTNFNLQDGTNSAIPFKFTYTPSGLTSQVTVDSTNPQNFSNSYDEGNNLITRTNPDNTQDYYSYNEGNQVVFSQLNGVTNSSTTPSSSYVYDQDGRVTSITGNGPGNPTASYQYNGTYTRNYGAVTEKLNRLMQATINGTQYGYSYDAAGNLLEMDVPGGHNSITYDQDNRILTINGSTPVYDDNGNLKSITFNGKTYTYTYDAANRLTSVNDGTTTTTYKYDADGQRVSKTAGSTTTYYHYFNGQLMYETLSTDSSNVIHALYIHTPEGKLVAVSLNYVIGGSNNTWYYYHYNAHGDVTSVTDKNGAIYRQYIYDPYGNVISVMDGSGTSVNINNDSGFNNAYTYAGYRYDSDTGLYYLNSRYYMAGIGRFLTKDSITGATKDTQSLNRYAYAEGDPVKHVDPTGHSADETGDPNHPYVSIGAGPADTGKLEFSNSGPAFIEGGSNYSLQPSSNTTSSTSGVNVGKVAANFGQITTTVGGAISAACIVAASAGVIVPAGLAITGLGIGLLGTYLTYVAYKHGYAGFGDVVISGISAIGPAKGLNVVGAFVEGGSGFSAVGSSLRTWLNPSQVVDLFDNSLNIGIVGQSNGN